MVHLVIALHVWWGAVEKSTVEALLIFMFGAGEQGTLKAGPNWVSNSPSMDYRCEKRVGSGDSHPVIASSTIMIAVTIVQLERRHPRAHPPARTRMNVRAGGIRGQSSRSRRLRAVKAAPCQSACEQTQQLLPGFCHLA